MPVLERLRTLVDGALATGFVQSRHGEHLPLFGKDGQYSLHAVPLEPGFPEAHVLLVVEDLSEVRALELRLLRAEKLATVGVLADGIAHEIGTPLGVVRGRAEYLLGKLPEDSRKPVLVRAAALAPIASGVAELLRFEAERREVTVAVAVPESLPLLGADPDQLQQVLVNLVMHACDACAPGGRVTITATSGGRVARIEVADDGCESPRSCASRCSILSSRRRSAARAAGSGWPWRRARSRPPPDQVARGGRTMRTEHGAW